jgi:NTP pyrophosphatase (non-canonical NTP hydrolase)
MNFAAYWKWVTWRWVNAPHVNDLAVAALGLTGEVGEIVAELVVASSRCTERVKKLLRDRTGEHEFDREAFKLEMGDALNYWCALAIQTGLKPEDIFQANHDKCEARNNSATPPNYMPPRVVCQDCAESLFGQCDRHKVKL